jgi:GT2 family glycosyltransferase
MTYSIDPDLAVVIPTYKRPHLLQRLLADLMCQSVVPGLCVVVDGAPESGDVLFMLNELVASQPWQTTYIPSNHANAPYQRYLGAEIAKEYKWVIFFDDDIRVHESDVIEKIIEPFLWRNRSIVGVSPRIDFPSRSLIQKKTRNNYLPGSVTPVGDRVLPFDDGSAYVTVAALRGGVMAYRLKALLSVMFCEDAFAMSHIRCGLGVDDTFLSRQVGQFGELLYASCVRVEHPDTDVSRAYPASSYNLAYARAYSRRFINDHFRVNRLPTLSDRYFLLKNLLGNVSLGFWRAFQTMDKVQLAYAWGYLRGALRAFLQEPTSKNLTPGINWRVDAEQALVRGIII